MRATFSPFFGVARTRPTRSTRCDSSILRHSSSSPKPWRAKQRARLLLAMSDVSSLRGFILEPTYRVEAGRPVVQLHGRLEDGRTFLVRDDRQTPHFYVEARDADHA